jgi:hypothetical protein
MNWQWNGKSQHGDLPFSFILTTVGTTLGWEIAPGSNGGGEEERNPKL